MADPIKICTDRILPLEKAVDAARAAISENPENMPVAVVRPLMGVADPTPDELALITGKKWENGRTLRIRFTGGVDILTLSGRGDKDLAEALAGLERLDAADG